MAAPPPAPDRRCCSTSPTASPGEHWAEGDLLTPTPAGPDHDPGGYALLDVKTVLSARDPDKVGRWLWQLLGYAWLDHARGDRHHITRVGLYFARHGHTITWPVHDLAAQLLDNSPTHPDRARAEFLDLACQMWRREAGHTHHPPT